MRQTWSDLLFAHWPVASATLRPLVPPELEIQEFEGTSWVGVVPFRMQEVTPRFVPAVFPWSTFDEINLRLYVEAEGKPGVWFLSLDATSTFAVWAARRFFHLPYFQAEISLTESADGFACRSRRSRRSEATAGVPTGAELVVDYTPTGSAYEATPGSLEHWLTERYCLYAQSAAGKLTRTEVHHHPWPLQSARATFQQNQLGDGHGLNLQGPPALLHFSRRIDVVAWLPQRVARIG